MGGERFAFVKFSPRTVARPRDFPIFAAKLVGVTLTPLGNLIEFLMLTTRGGDSVDDGYGYLGFRRCTADLLAVRVC